MSARAPFKHFDTYNHFLTKKVAYDSTNTSYVINNGTDIQNGEPDIFWQDLVFIQDIGQIWNRGRFYNHNQSYKSLAGIAKNTFEPFDGVLITFLEEDGRAAFLRNGGTFDTLQNYGITPSLSIVPKFIDNNQGVNTDGTTYPVMSMQDIYRLMDKYGCDIVNHTYSNDRSLYKSDEQYSAITNDLKQAEDWFISRGIFTNCLSYPDNFYTENDYVQNAVSKFENYAISDSTGGYYNHDGTQPYNFTKLLLSNSTVDDVISKILLATAKNSNAWIILSTHSCFTSSEDTGSVSIYGELTSSTLSSFIERINTEMSNKGLAMRYCTISEGLKIRAMESIGGNLFIRKNPTSNSTIGAVNIDNRGISAEHISASTMGAGSLSVDSNVNIMGSITLSSMATGTLASSITPILDFNSLSESFKNDMMNYIMSNWGTIS